MAATAVETLVNAFASSLTKQEEREVVDMFSSTLGNRYGSTESLDEICNQLVRDNRINTGDTFLLENCIGYKKEANIEKIIKAFKKKHKKEIARLEEQENLIIRREDIFDRVDTIMRNSHGVLLYGEAGVGKTFLARNYLTTKQKDNFKEVDLREIKNVNILMVNILQRFGFIRSIDEVNLAILGSSLTRSINKKRVILFLDNTDDFIDEENKSEKLKDLGVQFSQVIETVIQAGKGLIKLLITTRNPSENAKLNGILMNHKVGQLEKEFALKLIDRTRLNKSCEPTDELLNEAVEICKFLPLNLDLVRGMLQNFGTLISDVNHIVKTYAEAELKKISDAKLARKKEIEISTLGVLEANFDNLSDTLQQGAVALSLFCRPFQVNDVEFMFEDEMNVRRLNLIVHALKHQNVIQSFDGTTYDFHPMVRSFLENKKDIPHISAFYERAKAKFIFHFRTYFKKIARLLHNSYDHAKRMFQYDFANFQLTFDIHASDGIPLFDDYFDLQLTSGLLGTLFRKEWRIDFFQKAAENCLSSGDTLRGSLFLCKSAQSCADIYPHKALEILSRAEKELERIRSAEDSTNADEKEGDKLMAIESLYSEAKGCSFHCIGKNSKKESDVKEASSAYKKSYSLRDKIYGKKANEPDLATSLAGLGACESLHASILGNNGKKKSKKAKELIKEKLKIALDCLKASLKIYEKSFPYDPEVSTILQNIGHVYSTSEDYKDAFKYFMKALDREKDMKVDFSTTTALILFNLANTSRDLDKDRDALRFSMESFRLRKELLKNHPDTVKSLFQLAVIHHEQDMLEDALKYYKKAFFMEEELEENFHSPNRKDIREFMIDAFESAIEKGFTYLIDEMEEWKACFEELKKKEEDEEKKKLQEQSEQSHPHPQLLAEEVEIGEKLEQTVLEDTPTHLPYSKGEEKQEEGKEETQEKHFIDPGMMTMFMDSDGGKCEFQHLGVTLDVPQDSINNIELQISCVAPLDESLAERPLWLAFGDCRVSDIIKIGPDGQSFKRPASLSIPYSVSEVPFGRDIAIKCFNEETGFWDRIPAKQCKDAKNGNKIAVAEIVKLTMYVVCVLHNVFSYRVPSSRTEIAPFEGRDVKVIFDNNTFEDEDIQIDLKLSTFADDAVKRLKIWGLRATPVLHICTVNNEQLSKPVEIHLPLEDGLQKRGKLIVLQDSNETFEDITDDIKITKREHYISFKVDHFSRFVGAWTYNLYQKVSTMIEYLTDYLYPPLSVWFQAHGARDSDGWRMRVACAQDHHVQRMEETMAKTLTLIEQSHYDEGIYHNTRMNIALCGSFYIELEKKVTLRFQSSVPCYSELFRVMEEKEHAKGTDLVICSEDGGEYTRFPLPSLKAGKESSGSAEDTSLSDDSDDKSNIGSEPYRFFGLKFEKIDFEGVRIILEDVLTLEKLHILPNESTELIKSKLEAFTPISTLKLTLQLFSERAIEEKLTNDWFEVFFEKLGSRDFQESLRKVMDVLRQPCKDIICTSKMFSNFLRMIYTRDKVFRFSRVSRYFFRGLDLTPADRETIKREASGNLCKEMLEQSFLREGSKINCLFDIVVALLKTKTRTEKYERRGIEKGERIQRLLDDLGEYLEGNLIDHNDVVGGDDQVDSADDDADFDDSDYDRDDDY